MATKELTRADFKDVESVIPTEEEKLALYWLIYRSVHAWEIAKDMNKQFWDATFRRYGNARFSGKLQRSLTSGEAWDYARTGYGEDILKEFGDTEEEAYEYLKDTALGGNAVKSFITTREPELCKTFCKEYLAPLILIGMRGYILTGMWWRAVWYGFSVEPYTKVRKEGEKVTYNAFPYRSIKEMTEEDRRAFLWVVEDAYYTNVTLCSMRQREYMRCPCSNKDGDFSYLSKMTDEEFKQQPDLFVPYPEEGYLEEKIVELYSQMHKYDKDITVEDIRPDWTFELERFFSAAIHAQDKALYYAMKFSGTEYLDYIRSLDAVEDYKYHTDGVEGYDYDEIMKEGYVWHWEK